MASIFTKIIKREIPGHIVAEDESFIAILDINPVAMGHTLVIPKKEVDYIFDLDEEIYLGLHKFAKKVASGLEKAVKCERIGTCVVGLEVPHVHIHLLPLNSMDDINFSKPKLSVSNEKLQDLTTKISAELSI